MKKQIELTQALGKKLFGFIQGDDGDCEEIALIFNDDTFAIIRAVGNWNGGTEIETKDIEFKYNNYAFDDLIQAGVMSKEGIDSLLADKKKSDLASSEEFDRKLYEQLKKKFEDKT